MTVLGDSVLPLENITDSDAGFHAQTYDVDNLDITYENIENTENSNPLSENVDRSSENLDGQPSLLLPLEPAAVMDIPLQLDDLITFPSGKNKRRPVLRSTYENLAKITEQRNEKLNRAEENEKEILNLKRKRVEIDEKIAKNIVN